MNVAGIRGFEPLNPEIKTRCLTAWRYPNCNFKSLLLFGIRYSESRDPILKSCDVLPINDIQL